MTLLHSLADGDCLELVVVEAVEILVPIERWQLIWHPVSLAGSVQLRAHSDLDEVVVRLR